MNVDDLKSTDIMQLAILDLRAWAGRVLASTVQLHVWTVKEFNLWRLMR